MKSSEFISDSRIEPETSQAILNCPATIPTLSPWLVLLTYVWIQERF